MSRISRSWWHTDLNNAGMDLFFISLAGVTVFTLSMHYDFFEMLFEYSRTYEFLEFDEIIMLIIVLAFGLSIFSIRRCRELNQEVIRREQIEEKFSKLNQCFISFSPDPSENINRLISLLGELLNSTSVIYNCLRDGFLCSEGIWQAPPDYNPVDRPDGHICYDVIKKGGDDFYIVHDLQNTDYARTDPNVSNYKLQTYIGKAIKIGGIYHGTICAIYQKDTTPDKIDLKIHGIIASAIGIEEERRLSLESLRNSEEKYQAVVDDMPGVVTRFLPDGTITFANEVCCDIFGKKEEDMIDLDLFSMIAENEREKVKSRLSGFTVDKPVLSIENSIINNDGEERYYRWIDRAIFDENNRIIEFQSIGLDITDEKQVQEELLIKSDALESAYNAIAITDMDGLLTYVNPAALNIWGYSQESEVPGKPVFLAIRDEEMGHSIYQTIIDEGQWEGEIIAKKKDGSLFDAWIMAHTVRDSEGNPLCIMVTGQDITEQKDAKRALLESEKRFRSLCSAAPDGIAMVDDDGVIRVWNEAAGAIFGALPDEVIGKKIDAFMSTKCLNNYLDDFKRSINTGCSNIIGNMVEFSAFRKNGEEFVAEVSSSTLQISGKWYVIGTIRDITWRKQMEKAILESEKLYRTVFENTGTAMLIIDEDMTIVHVNRQSEKISGHLKEEVEGLTKWPDYVVEDDLQAMLEKFPIDRESDDTDPEMHKFRFYAKNGDVIYASMFVARIPGTKRTIVSIHDVTRQKLAEINLRESEERLNLAARSAGLGIWEVNIETGEHIFSDHVAEIFGYAPEELKNPVKLELLKKRIHPDDLRLMDMTNHTFQSTKESYIETEIRVFCQNGGTKWANILGKVTQCNKSGRPLRATGVIMDVTESRQYRDALKVANSKLNLLSSISRHDMVNQIMAIQGYMKLMETTPADDPKKTYFLQKVKELVERIRNEVLFTRDYQDLGIKTPAWQRLDIMVNNIVSSAIPKNITVEVSFESLEIYADLLLKKVIYNLLENAVRHGGNVTAINVSFQEKSGNGIIVLEDNGVGVAEDMKTIIFKRGVGSNTGLGLFLSKEILEITGISIQETGEEGAGARFEILVPDEGWRWLDQSSDTE